MSSQKKKDDLNGEPVGDSGLPKPQKAAIVSEEYEVIL